MDEGFLIACKACHRQYDVTGMKVGERVRCGCGELIRVPERPIHEARMLHCSACGGRLRHKASTCEYCGGEVTLADRNMGPVCPECFARLPAGAQFCSDCGVKIRPEALRAIRAAASCPRCKSSLVQRELPNGSYTECTGCGGIWLDEKMFERIMEEKDGSPLGKAAPGARTPETPKTIVEGGTVRYVPCPTCGNLMHRKNFANCSGIVVDWCKGHGFWFDAQELEKIVEFIKNGGLDKARRTEIERARQEIARLKDHQKSMAAAGPAWGGAGGYRSSDFHPDLGGPLGFLLRGLFGRL